MTAVLEAMLTISGKTGGDSGGMFPKFHSRLPLVVRPGSRPDALGLHQTLDRGRRGQPQAFLDLCEGLALGGSSGRDSPFVAAASSAAAIMERPPAERDSVT